VTQLPLVSLRPATARFPFLVVIRPFLVLRSPPSSLSCASSISTQFRLTGRYFVFFDAPPLFLSPRFLATVAPGAVPRRPAAPHPPSLCLRREDFLSSRRAMKILPARLSCRMQSFPQVRRPGHPSHVTLRFYWSLSPITLFFLSPSSPSAMELPLFIRHSGISNLSFPLLFFSIDEHHVCFFLGQRRDRDALNLSLSCVTSTNFFLCSGFAPLSIP